ncbi:MAG: hypothetical protein ACYC26_14910 [Phycisphaerales bacterium]
MMKRREPHRLRTILLLLCVVSICHGCATQTSVVKNAVSADGLHITLEVQRDSGTYTLRVQNISGRPLMVYDDFTEQARHRWHDGPAQIRVRDAAGRIVSTTADFPDGWWTSAVFSSDIVVLPAELRTLQPREKIAGTFQIAGLCRGLDTHGIGTEQWLQGKNVRLRASVHTDGNLSHAHRVTTDWFAIKEH